MDMFMKSLRPFIYELSSSLNKHNIAVKKSSLYELVSAYLGFKSYAALKQSGLKALFGVIDNVEVAKGQVFDRGLKLGLAADAALNCANLLNDTFSIRWFKKELFDLILADQFDFYHKYDFEYLEGDFEDDEAPSWYIDLLSNLYQQGCKESFLLLVCLCSSILQSYDENLAYQSAKYWFDRLNAGKELSDMHLDIAKSYPIISHFETMLKELSQEIEEHGLIAPKSTAPLLGALNKSCECGYTDELVISNHLVLETLSYLENKNFISVDCFTDQHHYWEIGLLIDEPSNFVLSDLISSCDTNEEKWFWHLWGLANDVDVTEDNIVAYHAYTGEVWDGEGDAPLEIGGYQAINLPSISEQERLRIESLLP